MSKEELRTIYVSQNIPVVKYTDSAALISQDKSTLCIDYMTFPLHSELLFLSFQEFIAFRLKKLFHS